MDDDEPGDLPGLSGRRMLRFRASWVLAGLSLLLLLWGFVACWRSGWAAGQFWGVEGMGFGVLALFTHWPGRC